MRRGRTIFIPALLAAFLASIWIFSAARHAFDDDEFQHAHLAWLLHHGAVPYKDFFEHHLVTYHRLMAPLFNLGEAAWQIFLFRGISLLAAAGALVLLYRGGRSLGLSPLSAFTGVWLLGLAPMFLLKMTEARPEALAILAFAGALSLTFAQSAESPEPLPRKNRWRFVGVGILIGAMTLFSQKYVIAAGTVLAALYFLHGWKPATLVAAAFGACLAAYACWMLAIGAGGAAFESLILLNLGWKYSFSPSGYFVELFTTAGILIVGGVFGILRALFQGNRRRQAFALATLLAGCVAQILLVPVPYRQSFLPLLAILSLGAMFFASSIFHLAAAARREWLTLVIPLLLGTSSMAALPRQLSADNRADLLLMRSVAETAPSGPVFDGRGLLFFRPHVGRHACMHQEILMMLDANEYAQSVVNELKEAGFPPVLRDYRVRIMPDAILSFIAENYLPTGIPELLVAGIAKQRIAPGKTETIDIMASGAWQASWSGGNISMDGKPLVQNRPFSLEKGEHAMTADGLVWNFRLERKYGGR